jgi:glutamate-1-semialdehyde 2,1-aminomutase
LTHHYGSVLIYDEVMTGFRLALGGAQQLLGDQPDLTVLGKIVGGGFPVGAYGGRAAIMQQVMPAGPVFQAGTLSGNPVAMAAGVATLRELIENPPYSKLEVLSANIEQGLTQACRDYNIPHQFNRLGSMWTLFFTPTPVRDLDTAKTSDTKRFAQFFWGMIERGVYLPCSQYEAAFTSAAHGDSDIAHTVSAAREIFGTWISDNR